MRFFTADAVADVWAANPKPPETQGATRYERWASFSRMLDRAPTAAISDADDVPASVRRAHHDPFAPLLSCTLRAVARSALAADQLPEPIDQRLMPWHTLRCARPPSPSGPTSQLSAIWQSHELCLIVTSTSREVGWTNERSERRPFSRRYCEWVAVVRQAA
jgi:hypothetical protein